MLIAMWILLGFFCYGFLARVFHNLYFDEKGHSRISKNYWDSFERYVLSIFFPVACAFLLAYFLAKVPIKLADFICNPQNYKFRIKFEKRSE